MSELAPDINLIQRRPQRHESKVIFLTIILTLATYWLLQQWSIRDWWSGLWYQADEQVATIEESLNLTNTGQRILNATHPAVELQEAFNAHCDSHKTEISLLGCYAGGRIYVYEITLPELVDSNKVTMAHELLHAAWERMDNREHDYITNLIKELKTQYPTWFEEELALYEEQEKIEEAWARAGTKLANLPEKLEECYAKYFNDRQAIVGYYEHYQAPFLALKEEAQALYETIIATSDEIILEKESYAADVAALDLRINEFNSCANTMNCFRSNDEFQLQRSQLIAEQGRLDQERLRLNQKIDENNNRIEAYAKNQLAIGELNNAMNSNVVSERIEL